MASRPAHNPRSPYIDGSSALKAAYTAAGTIDAEAIKSRCITMSASDTLTLATAATLYGDLGGSLLRVGDYHDICVVNTNASGDVTVAVATGITAVGDLIVEPDSVAGEENSGSAQFRLQWTVVGSSPTADLIRLN